MTTHQEAGPLRWLESRLRRITSKSHTYIPEIDGLRFIAISWVVLFHAFNGAGRAIESLHGPEAVEALPVGIAYGGRGGVFKAMLSWSPITIIGGMCYSIYLIHNPLFSFIASRIVQPAHDLMTARLLMCTAGIAIVLFVGTIFYLLVERPCMNPAWPRRVGDFFRWLFRPNSSDKPAPP